MSLPLNTVITRHPDMLSAEIGGEAVMMSIEKGAYFGLNPVATRIWDLIEQPKSLSELIAAILGEYEVSAEQCEADVREFTADMIERGLAQVA
jgi:Coenzyme PQQ synthesis protein D (PqqD)